MCPPGLTFKHGISVGAGVIDSDYRGNIKVILFNHGPTDYQVEKGHKIAQLILEKIYTIEPAVVAYKELDDTERGAGRFGSTGV